MAPSEASESDLETSARQPLNWGALLLILPFAGALFGLIVASVASMVEPQKYRSVAVVEVHPSEARAMDRFGSSGLPPQPVATPAPRFLASQIEIITSQQTLKDVVRDLDLTSRWQVEPDLCVEFLDANVDAEQVGESDLVRITSLSNSAQDARDVAKAVAEAYAERRMEDEMAHAKAILNALDSEIRDQEDLVEDKRKVLHTIAQAVGIPFFEEEGGARIGEVEKELYAEAERERAAARREKQILEIRIKTALRLNSEALVSFAATTDRSPSLTRWWYQVLAKRNELKARISNFEEGHPDRQEIERELEHLTSEVGQKSAELRDALQVELDLTESRLQEMGQVVSRARDEAVDKALESQDYLEAAREYAAAQDFLQKMKTQHASERIALKIPKRPMTLHEEPQIGRLPAAPRASRWVLAGMVVGGLGGLLITLPTAGLMMLLRR